MYGVHMAVPTHRPPLIGYDAHFCCQSYFMYMNLLSNSKFKNGDRSWRVFSQLPPPPIICCDRHCCAENNILTEGQCREKAGS